MHAHESIPPELIESILLFLPVKSLGRFKSVSKPWCSLISKLISNPEFIKTHLRLNKTKNLILRSRERSLFSVNINELHPRHVTNEIPSSRKELTFEQPSIIWERILGSCDGLVLAKDKDQSIFLMNPTTRELSKLPVSPFALPLEESSVTYGFGYDSSTNDYKVVTISFWDIVTTENFDDLPISVYSLKNNSWRMLPDSPWQTVFNDTSSGVLVNENLHWLTYGMIFVFSLADEKYTEIKLLDSIENRTWFYSTLAVVGGKLVVFEYDVGNDLLVMVEYGVSESECILVCWVDDGDQDLVTRIENQHDIDDFYVYNVDGKRCRNVRMLLGPSGFTIGGMYVESLVSPRICD